MAHLTRCGFDAPDGLDRRSREFHRRERIRLDARNAWKKPTTCHQFAAVGCVLRRTTRPLADTSGGATASHDFSPESLRISDDAMRGAAVEFQKRFAACAYFAGHVHVQRLSRMGGRKRAGNNNGP